MSELVGIDPSLTSTGIAVLTKGVDGLFSTQVAKLINVGHPGTDSDDWDDRSRRIVSQTRHIIRQIDAFDLELAVIEGPSYGSKFGSAFDRAALWHGVYSHLRARKVKLAVCQPGTREKWATGKVVRGLSDRERKARVFDAVREQWAGVRVPNHDCADALTLAGIGALKLGWQLPFEIKERHYAGLDKVAWSKEIA